MDKSNTDEDEIDTEALQAQIDLSMSFAQNLVSSWVKPSRKLPQRNRDVEAELKEYMRRPPRLGVGAPIPETQSFSRETARLKGQLIGKSTKRSRNDEEDAKRDGADTIDDGEDESRAGAIKKKARLDPFGDGHGKKKKKKQVAPNSGASCTSAPDTSQQNNSEKSEQAEVIGIITEVDATGDVASSSSQPSSLSAPQSVNEASVPSTKPMSNSTHSANRNSPEKPRARAQLTLQVADVSLISPVTSPSRRSLLSQPAAVLQQPVLNLNPLSSDDHSDLEAELEAPSPKKKRKRRKKKKKHQSADVTMAAQANGDV